MVEPLLDAVGVLGPLEELFPAAPLEAWEPYRALYPELFAGDSWRLPVYCFLVRAGGQTVLIDTGAGPPGAWRGWEPEREGGLLPALTERGVSANDVDVVLLTHIHVDHVGWNTDSGGEALFPRARYLLHEDALATAHERKGEDRPHIERCILGIEDRIETFSGEAEVAPGVTTVPLPGHDPGHVGVRAGDTLMLCDAASIPALLDHPDWHFLYDADPERAEQTRRELLAGLRGERLMSSHYTEVRS